MNTTLYNRSRFEATFANIFETHKRYIRQTNFRYYVIFFSGTESHTAEFHAFKTANHTTLMLAESFSKAKEGHPYYVGLWQRHKDGTCHRVCYAEQFK